MRHTREQLIAAIDRHAPKDWRRSLLPEPKILMLPELSSFVLSSMAFSQGHLWREAWAGPDVGFPMMAARAAVRSYYTTHQNGRGGYIHFGSAYMPDVVRLIPTQDPPTYMAFIVRDVSLGNEVFQQVELFQTQDGIRLRFLMD